MSGYAWYAVRVRSNTETLAVSGLLRRGLESYYPHRPHPSRRATRPIALFPGYVFARFEYEDAKLQVIRAPYVVQVIGGRGDCIQESDINAIRRFVDSDYPLLMHHAWKVGQRVRITRGAFAGIEGMVLRQDLPQKPRVLVSVELISRAISVQVDADLLYAI